jgi:hypothetical protein
MSQYLKIISTHKLETIKVKIIASITKMGKSTTRLLTNKQNKIIPEDSMQLHLLRQNYKKTKKKNNEGLLSGWGGGI